MSPWYADLVMFIVLALSVGASFLLGAVRALQYADEKIAEANKTIERQNKCIADMKELVEHIWLHSNYSSCGSAYMTAEQRALFTKITGEGVDD